MHQGFSLHSIPPGEAVVYEVRPCEGTRVCWPWDAPHLLIAWRTEDDKLIVVPENGNGSALESLSNPLSAFGGKVVPTFPVR